MKKTIAIGFTLCSLAYSNQILAAEIHLSITGEGTVTAKEAGVECSEDCIIENSLPINTLLTNTIEGSQFVGWTGQQCDAGEQVTLSGSYSVFNQSSGGAKTLDAADINGDGVTDLAKLNLFTGKLSTLINQGDGSFDSVSIDDDLGYPTALTFHDWDGDNDQDLLVIDYSYRFIKLYSNDGNGNFALKKDITIDGVTPYAIAVEDINNDGFPDLALSSFTASTNGDLFDLVNSINSQHISLYINDGNDSFSHYITLSENAAMTLDVHRKPDSGRIDVVAAEIINGEVALYSLTGDTVNRQVVDSGGGTYGAAFGDIDGNGTADVLAAHYRPSTLNLIYANEDGTFEAAQNVGVFSDGVTATTFIDINNDGYQDVATGIFNDNQFISFETKGYVNCVISKDAKVTLTANFSSNAVQTEVKKSTDSSDGGGLGWAAIIMIGLSSLFRRKYLSTNN
ncbi:VCBS repeat-containing protein [Shewanella sp. 1_MG-2023]|uniref:FG-GAP repeat domain-containing protein n=1 Tax=unclassified Shewanella TaxID=196818 RepID=UPI0026E2A20E|nr:MULTISPECIES: VCBS repeat-containing protein [unclassified Shewanella]MDO6612165.1 VCBS repeat-containing protein [Shewanella sp. 7_MG-2023]MDO6772019.1 VCBS repeat-containing protein [Shewanella sp. 2_MG-2023]MDO6795759.1 VCBS repeat-containing protein [Shewanella sp. 1_MG-2023]